MWDASGVYLNNFRFFIFYNSVNKLRWNFTLSVWILLFYWRVYFSGLWVKRVSVSVNDALFFTSKTERRLQVRRVIFTNYQRWDQRSEERHTKHSLNLNMIEPNKHLDINIQTNTPAVISVWDNDTHDCKHTLFPLTLTELRHVHEDSHKHSTLIRSKLIISALFEITQMFVTVSVPDMCACLYLFDEADESSSEAPGFVSVALQWADGDLRRLLDGHSDHMNRVVHESGVRLKHTHTL